MTPRQHDQARRFLAHRSRWPRRRSLRREMRRLERAAPLLMLASAKYLEAASLSAKPVRPPDRVVAELHGIPYSLLTALNDGSSYARFRALETAAESLWSITEAARLEAALYPERWRVPR